MKQHKYFKPGQKILLRSEVEDEGPRRVEALTVYFHGSGPGYFDLNLPYRSGAGQGFPFSEGMPFVILSDALGLGVRLTGRFHSMLSENLVRVEVDENLEVIQRRIDRRLDVEIGLRYTKGTGDLRAFRLQWEKNVRALEKGVSLSKLQPFPPCKVNLSPSGIRFPVSAPVALADLCLLLMQLRDDGPPMCVLSEIVWLEEEIKDGRQVAGMRFISVLEGDRKRLEKYIADKIPR